MLLDLAYKLTKKGEDLPLSSWKQDFLEVSKKLKPALENIIPNLKEGTNVRANVQKLVTNLSQENPVEFDLAQGLYFVAGIFSNNAKKKKEEIVADYIVSSGKFYKRAKAAESARLAREDLKDSLSEEEQNNYDKKLFEDVGMMYCLEYYLALYKKISDADSEEEKKKYIEAEKVDLGFGDLPGLWIDFHNDEVLHKFIFSVLNDKIREELLKAYFEAKMVIIKAKEIPVEETMLAFKKLILQIMIAFRDMGIEQLASHFFTPYGEEPYLKDIKL